VTNYQIKGGITGKILRVNLSDGKIWTEDTEKYLDRFLCGRTLASYILLTQMDPKTKWSDPENLLIFSPGIFNGTAVPGASRTSIDSINVFTNGKGSANFGGNVGSELKMAGYDMLIVTGQSEKPVYLWIHDKVEIKDASSVWGQGTLDTDRITRNEIGVTDAEMLCIGPAGENLVKAACIVGNCGKVAGGSGLGCVMGAKRLKAVVVKGNGSVNVAAPKEIFLDALERIMDKFSKHAATKVWQEGTLVEAVELYPEEELNWAVRTIVRNGQDAYWPIEKRKNILKVEKYRKKKWACSSCPFGGLTFNHIDEGKYEGSTGNCFWINSLWWNERLDIDDPQMAMKYHLLLNDLGLDGDNATGVISWLFECFEKGMVSPEDVDGLNLEWGDGDTVFDLARKLAYREGIGDFLADGAVSASRKLGKGSEKFAIHMKGQDSIDPYRVRKGWALAVATSPVGGRHLRGGIGSKELFGPLRFTEAEVGFSVKFDPTKYEYQAECVVWQLLMKEIEDTTGLCMYMGSYDGGPLSPKDYLELINLVTGLDWSMEEMMNFARRGVQLEKAFNTVRTEFTREDDLPNDRFFDEPIKSGPFVGEKLDRDKFNWMLSKYYELLGWDQKSGLQTHSCLESEGLEDIAEIIKKTGRLVEK